MSLKNYLQQPSYVSLIIVDAQQFDAEATRQNLSSMTWLYRCPSIWLNCNTHDDLPSKV